jgi:hypothetical protein
VKLTTPCPHCKEPVRLDIEQPPRQSSELAKAAATLLITLATAFAGCYAALYYRDYERAKAFLDAAQQREAEQQKERDDRMDRIRQQIRDGR